MVYDKGTLNIMQKQEKTVLVGLCLRAAKHVLVYGLMIDVLKSAFRYINIIYQAIFKGLSQAAA